MRSLSVTILVSLLSLICARSAAQATGGDSSTQVGTTATVASPTTVADKPSGRFAPIDPTGGAYVSPTLLFVPAASLPQWNLRLVLSSEFQSPADIDAVVRPGFGVELGLPARLTFAAGTTWVGGDVNPVSSTSDFNLGLSPYFQLRFNIYGRRDGKGFQLGTSVAYKFVGFEGDPGEIEWAMSAQFRHRYFEVGLQTVLGQDFADVDNHDFELHAYALARVVPALGIGAAAQVRIAIAPPVGSTDSTYDVVGGGLVSLTVDRYQVGALGGVSTIGLEQGSVGGLGQLFVAARF